MKENDEMHEVIEKSNQTRLYFAESARTYIVWLVFDENTKNSFNHVLV